MAKETAMEATFDDKFVAFIDILGFKNLVAAAEAGNGIQLADLLDLTAKLSASSEQAELKAYGPTVCPQSSYVRSDLSFRSTQISDSVIVSAEVSPAGAANFIGRCWGITVRLLNSGVLCRGYITRGSIFHTDTQVIGTAYQRAYQRESAVTAFHRDPAEQGTPFVEIDPAVTAYVKTCGDSCVEKIYARCTENDGELDALFPFRSLEQSFVIGGPYAKFVDYQRIRQGNIGLRSDIETLKTQMKNAVDPKTARAVQKVEHYIRALDRQLRGCDHVDQILTSLNH
jgi:hypothetical protein